MNNDISILLIILTLAGLLVGFSIGYATGLEMMMTDAVQAKVGHYHPVTGQFVFGAPPMGSQ